MQRREYVAMVEDLPRLTRWFGCEPPAQVSADLTSFMVGLEIVDRILDGLPSVDARARFGAEVIAFLLGRGALTHPELAARLAPLREALARTGLGEPMCVLARRALDNTEQMRRTHDVRRYIACAEEEGHLLVAMTLLFLEPHVTPAFVRFLQSLAAPCNLFDKLLDAREDFRRGELSIVPGLRLHLALLTALLGHLPAAMRLHPRWPALVPWALGYLPAVIRRRPPVAQLRSL